MRMGMRMRMGMSEVVCDSRAHLHANIEWLFAIKLICVIGWMHWVAGWGVAL